MADNDLLPIMGMVPKQADCPRCKGFGIVAAPLADSDDGRFADLCPDCADESGAYVQLKVTMLEDPPQWSRGGDGPVLIEVRVGPLRFRYYAEAGAPTLASVCMVNLGEGEFYRERTKGKYEEAPKPGGTNLPKCRECGQVLEAHIEHRCWTPEEAPK